MKTIPPTIIAKKVNFLRNIGRCAFSLVEVSLALGVVSFGFLPVVSLLPVALDSTRRAVGVTEAANILTAISADILATPSTATTSPRFSIQMPNATSSNSQSSLLYILDSGSNRDAQGAIVTQPAQAKYRASVRFHPSTVTSGTAIRPALQVNASITWPAAAVNSKQGSLETVFAINRR